MKIKIIEFFASKRTIGLVIIINCQLQKHHSYEACWDFSLFLQMPGKQKMLDTSGMDTSGGMINVSSDTYCVFEAARQSSFKDDDNFVQYLLYLYDR